MRTDEIEIRGRLIQVLLENTFHFNLFIRYIYIYIYKYIGIIEIEKLKINREIINKMEEKKNYSVMLNMIIKFFLAYSLAI